MAWAAVSENLQVFYLLVVLMGLGWLVVVGLFALPRLLKDIKRRDPANAPLWIALILFFGPFGILVWRMARPDLPGDHD
jgi:hypothetical protein